jgi:hypothetical protein
MNALFCHTRQSTIFASHYKSGAIVGVSHNGMISHYVVVANGLSFFFVEYC